MLREPHLTSGLPCLLYRASYVHRPGWQGLLSTRYREPLFCNPAVVLWEEDNIHSFRHGLRAGENLTGLTEVRSCLWCKILMESWVVWADCRYLVENKLRVRERTPHQTHGYINHLMRSWSSSRAVAGDGGKMIASTVKGWECRFREFLRHKYISYSNTYHLIENRVLLVPSFKLMFTWMCYS